MSVQFILGAHPNRKRDLLIDEMHEQLQHDPNTQILYLVPDNVKYETETMILKQFKNKEETSKYSGMIRLQVFSFSRLAWYLLQNKPIYQHPQLTDSGLGMLVKKILQEEEQNLTIFRGASQQTGFIERLVTLFSELRNGKISPVDLIEIASNVENDRSLENNDFKQKIDDLSLLFSKYDEALQEKYVEREDLFHELVEYFKTNKNNFKNTTVIIDHYEHFSAQEQELIVTLAKYTNKVFISLTLDEKVALENNDLNNLFYRPTKTYQQLKYELEVNQISVKDNIIISSSKKDGNENISKEIDKLASYWIESSKPTTRADLAKYQNTKYENIELWAAEDKVTEVSHIATKIKRMVASGNYRYNDFQIMTRDLESCALNVERAFTENGIPFFIDQAETMAHHPILEFVTSLFALKKKHYRLNDIFRFLRTELFIPMDEVLFSEEANFQNELTTWREQVDIAENVALAYGYQGNDWVKDEEWIYAQFELEEDYNLSDRDEEIQMIANRVRQSFKENIVPFIHQLEEGKTNKEIAILLYNFMSEIGVINQLQNWRDQLIDQGELEEAREHEQAWDTFIELLDEFVEVLGDEKWDIDLFISIMETGFEQTTFGMVPPAIDQVLVTNYDLPKIQSKKVVFLIGLTDTQLPQVQGNRSLLTDEDREIVEHSLSTEKYLAVSEMESVANEPFAFYLAILQAEEKIIFTYPLSNSDNGENRISPYLSRIKNTFALETQFKHSTATADSLVNLKDSLDFIGSKTHTFGQMIINLRYAIDHLETPSAFWLGLFKKLYNPSDSSQRRMINSLNHKNIPKPLSEELAEELYGKDLYLSVSQLETFYADPYSHFLLYGLRLKERQIQELSPIESGNFYHDALDLISRQLVSLNKNVADISKRELQNVTSDIFQMLLNSNKYRLSRSSNRMNFIFNQLSKTVENMVWSMIHQAKRSKYRVNKTELVFGQLGQQREISGLSFPLNNNRELHLRGKVDRIDTFEENDQLYAGIVDYKSSDTTFNYQSIYYGLMLQMITYLDTVLTFSEDIFNKKAKGIGAFYSTVKNHFIDLKDLGNKDFETELLKNYKLDGLMVNQREVLEAADLLLEPKEYSPIFNLYLNKDDNYTGKKILTEEEFELLMRFNRDKIIEAGNSILAGKNTLHPFDQRKIKVHTPSITGPYRAISQFDALLPENNYKDVLKMDKEDFFDHLRQLYSNREADKKEADH